MLSNIVSWWHMIVLLGGTLVLSGCENASPPPIDVRAIGKVQAEIKRQVAIYLRMAEDEPVYVKIGTEQVDIRGKTDLFWCGAGNVDYDISAVQAELTTALNLDVGFSATVSPPSPVAPSATFSFSRATSNSQALVYNLWPLEMKLQDIAFKSLPRPTGDEISSAPIAQVLLNLRQAQISGATKIDYTDGTARWAQPCFSNYDPGKPASDAGNSYTIALTITTSAKGDISVGVSALKVGVSAGSTTVTGHTLKVIFVQRNLWILQILRDRVDADCKYPNALSAKCTTSTNAYNRFRTTGVVDEELLKSGTIPRDYAGGHGGIGIQGGADVLKR